MKTRFLFLFLIGLSAWAEDIKVTSLIEQGDVEDRQHHVTAALADFRAAEQLEPKNLGVLLRIAKQYSDLVGETQPAAAARHVADDALAYSQRAVAVDPASAKAHLSVAVSYGRLIDFTSGKTKLAYSKIVHDEVLKSIELDPTDDFAWHVLGRWHYGVANVNGMLRVMADLVYGGLPKASNEDAVKYLKRAISIAPQRVIHHVELAHVYKAMARNDLATKEWEAVLSLPADNSADEKFQKEAQVALGGKTPGRSAVSGP